MEVELIERASRSCGVPLDERLGPGHPRIGGGGVSTKDDGEGGVAVDQVERQVGQRIAESGHLPVDQRAHLPGGAGVEDRVVDTQVPVHDRVVALGGTGIAQPPAETIHVGDLGDLDAVPLSEPAIYLAPQVIAGIALGAVGLLVCMLWAVLFAAAAGSAPAPSTGTSYTAPS